MRRPALLALVATLLLPAVAQAQMTQDGAKAKGQQFVQWIYDFQIDSLYEHMTPEFRDQIGGREAIEAAITSLITEQGLETEVVKEGVSPAEGGAFHYSRVIRLQANPDQLMEWTFTVSPDGRMATGGMRVHSGE